MKIEANIPITPPAIPDRQEHVFPVLEMEVGDSFLIPWDGKDRAKYRSVCRTVISRQGARHGMKFATRTLEEGLRVWRID